MGGHYKKVVTIQPKREDFTQPTNPAIATLDNVDQIIIKQHLSIIEAVTDFDRINRYYIWDGKSGQQLFTASEGDIGWCSRNCWQGAREFDMPFLNQAKQEAFQLNKTRSMPLVGCCLCSCCMSCYKSCGQSCCGFDSDYSNLSVNRMGTKDYYIHQNHNFAGHPNFSIKNVFNDETEFIVSLDTCCFSAYNCTDVVYDVHDKNGVLVGNITKWWAGGKTGIEGCCIESANASTYVIDIINGKPGPIPTDLTFTSTKTIMDAKQKSALIGVTLLIDYSFYQKKDNDG